MRRSVALLAATAALAAALPAFAADLHVSIDQSRRVVLRGAAANVFIGNPAIADVTMVDRRSLLVTGKGYGSTNLLVVDGAGRTLLDQMVLVSADGTGVTLQRGVNTFAYSCTPACLPSRGNGGAGAPTAAAASSGGVGTVGGIGNPSGAIAAGAAIP